ncbi:SDR family oxidoreductase [Marinilactibacillus kalidii]|uniref:SDR family oxidoreductase n=1 Tax=Marinilactibacillus kalidii TaxID=2820274 RepID=UPI001ABEDB17|nr:SDR family oxidoreductase [Marinilactibacillus kalidii]
MTIAITGATGHLGRQVIQTLIEKKANEKIVAVVRDQEKANNMLDESVESREANYDNFDSLLAAFKGIDQLLFISSPSNDDMERVVQHATVVKAARDAGVSRIYYTSFANADHSTIPLAKLHIATEAMIKVSGLQYTFVRNPLYTDVFINPSLNQAISDGKLVSNTGNGRLNTASREDLAKATAALLMKESNENEVVELAASETWSFQELADTLSHVSGKEVTYQAVSQKEAFDYFTSTGLPEPVAQFTVALYDSISEGDIQQTSNDLKELIGKETTLSEAVKQAIQS